MHLEGMGVTEDYAEAIKWWKLAAEQGDEEAQYNLDNYNNSMVWLTSTLQTLTFLNICSSFRFIACTTLGSLRHFAYTCQLA